MPAVYFTVELPDGTQHDCYSPSTVIHEHFKSGDAMSMDEFVARSRIAFQAASERVRQRFGYGCSSAMDQLGEIEDWAKAHRADAPVKIIHL